MQSSKVREADLERDGRGSLSMSAMVVLEFPGEEGGTDERVMRSRDERGGFEGVFLDVLVIPPAISRI